MTALLLWAALALVCFAWLAGSSEHEDGLPMMFVIPIFLGLFFASLAGVWSLVWAIMKVVTHG